MGETELSRMVVRILGDATSYIKALTVSSTATQAVTQQIQQQANKIESYTNYATGFVNQIKATFLSALGIIGLFGTGLGALQKSAQAEDLRTSFGVMLQDMAQGETLVKRIQQLAAETPLESITLTQAAKGLLQANLAADEIVPTLRMLGDTASGNADQLTRMAYAFQQIKTFGKLMGGELMQLNNAGFNPLAEMARTSGKSLAKLMEEMHEGKITFEQVKNAFKTATSQGGRFFEGMEKGSKTLNGLFSTLKDDIGLTLQEIGDGLVKAFDLKNVIRNLSQFTAEVKRWSKVVVDGILFVKKEVVSFVDENQELIKTSLKVGAALLGALAIIKLLGVGLGILTFVFKLLKLDLILSTGLWVVWKVAVLAAKAVMLLFSAAVMTFNVVFAAASLLMLGWTALTGIATAATWLFNAALAVLNAELIIPAIIGAAASIGLLVAAFAVVYGAAVGVIAVFENLVEVFSDIGDVSGPLGEVTKLFDSWLGAIDNITRAVKVDFALAWKFVVAYGNLAVQQIKDLWPPLWTLLQEGFTVVWRLSSFTFVTEFKRGFAEVLATVAKHADVFGLNKDKIKKDIEDLNKAVKEGQAIAAAEAGKMLKEALDRFKVIEGEGAKAAIETIKKLQEDLEFEEWLQDWMKSFDEEAPLGKAKSGMDALGAATKKTHHEMKDLKAVLADSQEGFARLLEHKDFLEGRFPNRNIASGNNMVKVDMQKSEGLLTKIEKNTRNGNVPAGVALIPANIK